MQTVQQEKGRVTFSYQENGYSYNFEFEDCAPNMYKRLAETIEEFHRNYGRHCADFFDIKDWQINDHNLIYRLSRRIKSIL